MTDSQQQSVKAFLEPASATIDDFERIDMRVARVVAVEPFAQARKPAYQLTLDFGPGGTRRSSAQLPPTYPDPQALVGRLVIAVVNFAPRNIAGFQSEVLVLGALPRAARSRFFRSTKAPRRAIPSADEPAARGLDAESPILPGSMRFRGCRSSTPVLVFAALGPGEWPEGEEPPRSIVWSGNPAPSGPERIFERAAALPRRVCGIGLSSIWKVGRAGIDGCKAGLARSAGRVAGFAFACQLRDLA